MAVEGILDARPQNVVITAGSQSAQDVATKLFCNPGDVVLVEDPTYVGALNTFEAYQVQVETVGMDESGLVPELLEARIAALQLAGKNIKFLYTIPNFNNPRGSPCPRTGASTWWIYAATRIFWWSRTTPMACSASPANRCSPSALRTRTT